MNYKIVIVDDHLLIAKAISGIIEHFPKYSVLYEVEHGKALIEKFNNPKNIPDIVLLDISMPVMDGFETAKWLKTHHPDVIVLTLSMQDDDLSLIKMIKAGAKGYLLKNIHPKELEKALDEVTSKGVYYPEWVASKVFMKMSGDSTTAPMDIVHLSEREIEFLKYCCTEYTYKEISEMMSCSARTVEGYRDILFSKLGLKTRVGLVLYAIKTGKFYF